MRIKYHYNQNNKGFLGHHHTEEMKRRLSEFHKGKPSPSKGKHWKLTEETRKKMSKARKGKTYTKKKKVQKGVHKKSRRGQNKGIRPKNWETLYTPEINEKRRIARLKQILPTIDTSIELKLKAYLEEKKINYIHPFNLGSYFQCDFYLPFLNLIVECDGTYWHSRPDMKRRDKAKDAYAKKCGFNLLRLTEEEINKGRFAFL